MFSIIIYCHNICLVTPSTPQSLVGFQKLLVTLYTAQSHVVGVEPLTPSETSPASSGSSSRLVDSKFV